MDYSNPQQLAKIHEQFVADLYRSDRSPSSGGAVTDEGDVSGKYDLVECKFSGSPTNPAKSISIKLGELEKIADEARSVGKRPGYALRIYNPNSTLADKDGMVDVMVRLLMDDEDMTWNYYVSRRGDHD